LGGMTLSFQRARRPEQMAARRAAILDAARAMLAEKGVADISLRELSQRVGLAKSNVLRYFDSREAIFLEVLDQECRAYLVDLSKLLGRPRGRKPGYASEIRVATVIAESLAERRLLCELISAMAGVLERNISTDFARDFKVRTMGNIAGLAELVVGQLPWLGAEYAALFAHATVTLAAGGYPFSIPTEAVAVAMAEIGMGDPVQMFVDGLREGLVTCLVGAVVRADGHEGVGGASGG
jgi:AcrR family transcriptional regulator